ncbi:MAG: winged helix-turn-helix domain-containing protein [Bdellovibrionales bacterium]|nr:winged helix-turn-helix domain-containing protein [Bdellovibrionales bacterium]
MEELRDWIELHYGVIYQSKQSYYDKLKEAGLSWHQTQTINEERDEDKVMLKREEIKKKLEEQQAEISSLEKWLFLLKMSVIYCQMIPQGMSGVDETKELRFQ